METPSMLQLLLQDFQETESSISVREYSGRAMFGKQCLAIDGDFSACQAALAYAIAALHQDLMADLDDSYAENVSSPQFEPSVDFEEFVQTALRYRQDQMGLGVVLYWPNVEYVDSPVNTGDDTDPGEFPHND